MKIGTRSLLFGIHQIFWHPLVVTMAWWHLYGRPSFKEFICIFIHDWGYWGKSNIDGNEGIKHPVCGANIAYRLFGDPYWEFCAGHSRSYINLVNMRFGFERYTLSKLCWADKLSFCFESKWYYIFRATLSGEFKEIYDLSIKNDIIKEGASKSDWYDAMYNYCVMQPEITRILKEKYGY
jgi:hypothetical protein